ncbi:MAG: glutamyl-tRNA synthetase [Cenarchaeum symbiont of Oopsacas minuta]|nr:glutamyl-tRNA synthetase [Cenarchaeum symbiont of Oopsacas minuta]
MDEDLRKEIRGFALQNASAHGGSTDAKIIIGRILGTRPELRSLANQISPQIQSIVAEINAMSAADQILELKSSHPDLVEQKKPKPARASLPELKDAKEGNVVTRFPPEPSGYPHIGHAKAAIINEQYVKMYGGRKILRLDDTNPESERLEFYAAIKVGLEWLGIEYDVIKNTSDDIEMLLEKGTTLANTGDIYVCTCKRDDVRNNRAAKKECKCRKLDLSDSMERWDKMFEKYKPGQAIARFRGDMSSDNTVMRDPVMFRIVEGKHPLLGTKYPVWPSYDFAISIEDSVDGVTHAFRSKEFELRSQLYYDILDRLSMRKPHVLVFSRLTLAGMPVSKRLIRPLIDEGKVSGYDDPRLPTIEALKRRGIVSSAVRKFVMSLGMTKSDTIAPFDSLVAFNRQIIDASCVRLFMIKEPISCTISGLPSSQIKIANHPTQDMGERTVHVDGNIYLEEKDACNLQTGSMLRLLGLGNVRIDSIEKPIKATYVNDEHDAKIPKVQWVEQSSACEVKLFIPGILFKDEKFNDKSMTEEKIFVEPYYTNLKDGQMVQMVRFGYCKKESQKTAIYTHG